MAVVDVKNLEGEKVGTVELADTVFGAKINPHLLHETSRWYLAWQRAGTHKTKRRSEVAGAGRKLWRQKGTGRARVGSIRSPLWRKGGTVHGPRPHKYGYAMPRKMLLGALRSALSAKLADEKLTVVSGWELESHKSGAFRKVLEKFDGDSRTTLLVDVQPNRNLELASRNLEGVKLVATRSLQPYDLMKHDRLVVSKDAAVKLGEALAPKPKANVAGFVSIAGAAIEAPKKAKPKKAAAKPRAARKAKAKE